MAQINYIGSDWRPIELPSGHVVKKPDGLTTTNDVIRSTDNARMLSGLIASGMLSVEYDPELEVGIVAEVSITQETDQNSPKNQPEMAMSPILLVDPPAGNPVVEMAFPAVSDETSGQSTLILTSGPTGPKDEPATETPAQ